MKWRQFCICCLTLGQVVALVGCSGGGGSSDATVKGKVSFDGKALSQARVVFEGEKSGANALTDEEGKFEIAVTGPYSLQPGKYVVLITKYTDKKGNIPPPEEYEQLVASGQLKALIPPKYADKNTTPFTNIEVKKGVNELPPFELKSK